MSAAPVITTAVDAICSSEPTARHTHREHELLWHVGGSFRVEVRGRSWAVGPGTGVWVAAGELHRTTGAPPYRCGWALIDTAACPATWSRTTPVAVDPLLAGLLDHLASSAADRVRTACEAVVLDLLATLLSTAAMELRLPEDERARRVVEALLDDPDHGWRLSDWAVEVGASSRTLSRVLLEQTGTTFGQWRAHARLRLAMALLAEGLPVAVVARRVGYRTPSAFVSAFRRLTGTTPGAYAGDEDRPGAPLRQVS